MKTTMSSILRLLVVLLAGSLGLRISAMPPAPWLPQTREAVRDQVGNAWLSRGRAVYTRSGQRAVGAAVPTSGTVRLLAIPVQFEADTDPLTSGTGRFPYRTWGPASTPGYLLERLAKIRQYFAEVSANTVDLQYTLTEVVTLPKTIAAYSVLVATDPTVFMRDLVTAGDANINFANADIIMAIHAGAGQEMDPNLLDIWSHHVTLDPANGIPTADGVTITGWAVQPETECNDTIFKLANPTINVQNYEINPVGTAIQPRWWDVVGVWAHELGHAFGMPDVYDVQYKSGVNLNYWSVMAAGSYLPAPTKAEDLLEPNAAGMAAFGSVPCHPDAWNKVLVGWSTPVNVTARRVNERIGAQGTPGASIYRMWKNGDSLSKEYFLLENRAKINFDQYVPEHGLMIYHIDDNAGGTVEANQLQVDGTHPRIMPESADNVLEIDETVNNFIPLTDTAFPGVNVNNIHFGKDTFPKSFDYANTETFVDVNNITIADNDVYADLQTSSASIIFINPLANSTVYALKPTIRIFPIDVTGLTAQSAQLNGGVAFNLPAANTATGEVEFQIDLTNIDLSKATAVTIVVKGQDDQGSEISASLTFRVKAKIIPAGLWMITLPVVDVGTVSTVFADQTLPRLAWWSPSDRVYLRYPNANLELTSQEYTVVDRLLNESRAPAGKAYWVDLPTNCQLMLQGDEIQYNRQYVLDVQQGFNMIGNPYSYAISFGSQLIEYNGLIYTMNEATSKRLIDPVLYRWDGSTYNIDILPNGTLEPWNGYWIRCRVGTKASPLRIIFQPLPVLSERASAPAAVRQRDGIRWAISLNATAATSSHRATATIGTASGATDQVDIGMDISAPPTSPAGISLASVSGRSGETLYRDYRAAIDRATYRWTLRVSGPAGERVVLTWPDLTSVPQGYQLLLHDPVTGEDRYLRTAMNYSVTLGAQETERLLTLTAMPGAVGTLQVQQLHATRSRATGTQLISGRLTQDATVTIEIRALSGRLIKRFTPTSYPQGMIAAAWDGTDAQGRRVPPGAYQCFVNAVTSAEQRAGAVILLLR